MIVSIVKGKCRDISSMSQRVEGVGEGRIVNYSDGSFLNCIQALKYNVGANFVCLNLELIIL